MSFEEDIEQALLTLRKGGTILYPTDTVWGIGCDATDQHAVQKIFQLKQRDDSKALIVLVADERDIMQYVAAPDPAAFVFLEQQTRPTTMIFDGAIGLADNLVAADGSIAIRICNDHFCRHLLRRLKKPIVSTSANISGQPAPAIFPEIDDAIRNGVDYVAHHRRTDQTKTNPSSVVRWQNGAPLILRP